MSGFGGAWLASGRAYPRALLQRLETALAGRGPDGTSRCWRAPVAFVHCRHDTTEKLATPAQPLIASDGTILVWDGRLDRRDVLATALGMVNLGMANPRREPDTELVLRAYHRWGTDCCRHLDGDFAFALWDPRQQSLTLARDPMGVRPLFFNRGRHGTIFASTLEAVLAATCLSRNYDETWFAGYFGANIEASRTPYRNITAVSPGSVVTLDARGSHRRRYWQPRVLPTSRLDDREQEARFAQCFERAVVDRMRTAGAVGADLSGGLDSSSIVCVAVAAGSHTIVPVSVVSDDSPTADERRYIEHVERALGIESQRFRHEDYLPYATAPPFTYDTPGGFQSIGGREAATDRWLAANDARVLLRGHGGDHLLWSQIVQPPILADLAVQGRFGRLAESLRQWSERRQQPVLPLLATAVIYPLLPRALRRRFGPHAPRIPTMLNRDFVRRTDLRRRSFWEHGLPRRHHLLSTRERLAEAIAASTLVNWSYDRGPGAAEARYPFLDRHLVEFCLSLPLDQLVRDDETRSIQRRALRGILPEAVRQRQSKAAFDEVVLRSLRIHGARIAPLLESPRVCDLGIVDGDALRTSFERNRYGIHDETPILRQVLDLELWLRGHEQAAVAPLSPPAPPSSATSSATSSVTATTA